MARIAARTAILANIVDALANEHSLEKNGRCIEMVAHQLNLAGVKVTVQEIRNAIDAVSETCPSTFLKVQPTVSTNYGPWGMEYRFRHSQDTYQAARACIDAVYAVTDTMDRTPATIQVQGQKVDIETIRPRAFATAMGYLRVRWAKGDFTAPSADMISKWVGIA